MKAKKLFVSFMVGVMLFNASSTTALAAETTPPVTIVDNVQETNILDTENQDTNNEKVIVEDKENLATEVVKDTEEAEEAEDEEVAEVKEEKEKEEVEDKEEKTEDKKKTAATKKKTAAQKKKEAAEQAEFDKQVELLAALIETEAGNQRHEGKVGVANVVLNRVGNKKITAARIENVIRAKGQFSVVRLGTFDRALKRYDKVNTSMEKACIKAAKAALNGENHVGKRLYFTRYSKSLSRKHSNGLKIEDHLFW